MAFYNIGLSTFLFFVVNCQLNEKCINVSWTSDFMSIAKSMVPSLEGKKKGESGKIVVIGGSTEYTGAPFFSAISSLKTGADLVYVITTPQAAPVIKSYSPDLIVYPFLDKTNLHKCKTLLKKMDVVIIGPGLGREDITVEITSEIFQSCKSQQKPLVVDADGLYVISKNLSLIDNYPSPGVILTPNFAEANRLLKVMDKTSLESFDYLGRYTYVLVKGHEDQYFTYIQQLKWAVPNGGSGRRAAGQGDILSGILATLYNWNLKSNLCNETSSEISASIATYAASVLTRKCNELAFKSNGRSMTASDMSNKIHHGFDELLEN